MNNELITKITSLQKAIENISETTEKHLSSVKQDKNDLLKKSVEKIHNRYNEISATITGHLSIKFDYQGKEYSLSINNSRDHSDWSKVTRYAYVSESDTYSTKEIMISTDLVGKFYKYNSQYTCKEYGNLYGLISESGGTRSYKTFYIKMLVDSEHIIDKLIAKEIEDKFAKESLNQQLKIAKELALLESLNNYNK